MKKYRQELRPALSRLLFLVGMLFSSGIFYWVWIRYYNQDIRHMLFRGSYVFVLMYFLILVVCTSWVDGDRVGESRVQDIVISQAISHTLTAAIIYIPVSLLRYAPSNPRPLLAMLAAQVLASAVWNTAAKRIYAGIVPKYRMLLLFDDGKGEKIAAKIAAYSPLYDICGKFRAVPGETRRFEKVLEDYEAVLVVVADDGLRGMYSRICFRKSVRMYVMPTLADIITGSSADLFVTDTPLLRSPLHRIPCDQALAKRAADIACSLLIMLATSPLWLATAAAVRLCDGGPVFFRQERLTKDGKTFSLYKFRSMRSDAEKDGQRLAGADDDRITPVGRVIRKFRIDELPQFLNVLKGDMSLVGPRPEVPSIAARYAEAYPEFPYRLKVRAGITGLAQVYGNYATHPEDKLLMDLIYVEQYSLKLDIRLLLMTIRVVFTPEKAAGVGEDASDILRLRTENGDGDEKE